MVVVFENRDDSGWKEISRICMAKNSLSPEFTGSIKMEYHFEMNQKIRFDVYDVDTSSTGSLDDRVFVGSTEVLLSEMLSKKKCHHTEELCNGDEKSRKEISIVCEEDKGVEDFVE